MKRYFLFQLKVSILFLHVEGFFVPTRKYFRTPLPTCDEIKFIVDYHNDARMALANGSLPEQPRADNMQRVAWDERLAEIASNFTMLMYFGHNEKRKDSRFSVGENLFMTTTSKSSNTAVEWRRPLRAWFIEYKLYKYVPTFDDPITLHYTQMIWADTIYIGCGTTQFYDDKNKIYKYYVCNYGPSGNFFGDFPYVVFEDDDELRLLQSAGLMTDVSLKPTVSSCPNLCCDHNQCDYPYGKICSGNSTD